MSFVTAADNAVHGIGKSLPGARLLGIVGRDHIRDLLLILGRGIPLYYWSPSISVVSKIWVVTGEMLKVLAGFHHRVEQQITRMTGKRGASGE